MHIKSKTRHKIFEIFRPKSDLFLKKSDITLAFCILVIGTRKQFQLQTGVFLKRPDVVTFDVYKLLVSPMIVSSKHSQKVPENMKIPHPLNNA